MREIKFRAWDKEKEEWAGADYWYEGVGLNFNVTPPSALTMSGKETHALMQYTGLKDINGVEIYEGDIIGCRNVITYVDSSQPENLGMSIGFYAQRDNFESFHMLDVGDEYEVLGNVYENPELLEVD